MQKKKKKKWPKQNSHILGNLVPPKFNSVKAYALQFPETATRYSI